MANPSSCDIGGIASSLAATSRKIREAERKRIFESEDIDARVPNAVRLRINPVDLIDLAFVNKLVSEAQGESGIFVEEAEGLSFGFVPEPTLRTETGDLWPSLQSSIRQIDSSKEALLLFRKDVGVKDASNGKDAPRTPFRLIKLKGLRIEVEIKGIALETTDQTGANGEGQG